MVVDSADDAAGNNAKAGHQKPLFNGLSKVGGLFDQVDLTSMKVVSCADDFYLARFLKIRQDWALFAYLIYHYLHIVHNYLVNEFIVGGCALRG